MWEIRSDMVDYPGHLLDAFLCLFVQLIYQHIGRFRDERDEVLDPAICYKKDLF